MSLSLGCHCEGRIFRGPCKGDGLCGERRSQATGGIFRLRKMEHCSLYFDDVAIRNTLLGNGFPRLLRSLGMTRLLNLMTLEQAPALQCVAIESVGAICVRPLGRGVQHIRYKDSIPRGRVIDKHVGHSTDELAVLDDGAAAHADVK